MDPGRPKFEPRVGVAATGTEPPTTRPPRANRLSRNFRLTQAAELGSPPSPRVPEFKTPTRTPRTTPASCREPRLKDSDFQQDIIWDGTSPSPRRPRKRGKKQTSRVVNISEIVSRIAPKHGRPEVAEPSLQQWVGDSATIPCTPDIKAPRTKRKSPSRASSVDDLLRLATRLDQNLLRPNQEDAVDLQNLDLLTQNNLDFQNTYQNKPLASLPENCQTPVNAAPRTKPDQEQNCQTPVNAAPRTKPDQEQNCQTPVNAVLWTELDRDQNCQPPVHAAPRTEPDQDQNCQTPVNAVLWTELDRDQNCQPPVNAAPRTEPDQDQNCQTPVNAASSTELDRDQQLQDDLDFLFDGPTQNLSGNLSPVPSAPSGNCGNPLQSGGPDSAHGAFEDDWENDDLLNDLLVLEMTQNPLSFTSSTFCSTQKPSGPVRPVSHGEPAALVRLADRVGPSIGPRVQKNLRPRATFRLESNSVFSGNIIQTNLRMDRQVGYRSTDGHLGESPSGTAPHRTELTSQPHHLKPEPQISRNDVRSSAETFKPDAVDFVDLDSLFSSDPVWDDLADDDLLWEMCEDLENQNQNLNTKQTPVLPNQRAALQPTQRTCTNRIQASAGGSSDPGGTAKVYSRAAPRSNSNQRVNFKKQNDPVTMTTSKGKCSAAEIELKKQQALERRYQRLQAQQNKTGIT